MAKLEEEIQLIAAKLADADLFTRDRPAFDQSERQVWGTSPIRLETAETRWLELEEKRARYRKRLRRDDHNKSDEPRDSAAA